MYGGNVEIIYISEFCKVYFSVYFASKCQIIQPPTVVICCD
jgi:hypothetical protein